MYVWIGQTNTSSVLWFICGEWFSFLINCLVFFTVCC